MSECTTTGQLIHLIPPKSKHFPASILYYSNPFNYNDDQVPFTKYFKIFFDFAYIFCLSPFRVKLHGSCRQGNVKYIPIHNFLQSSLCVVSSFLGIFWHVQGIREGLLSPTSKAKDPSNYFIIAQKIVGAIGKLLAVKVLWWNRKDILEILNHILQSRRLKHRVVISQHFGKVAFFICFGYTGITMLDFLGLRGIGKTGASSSTRYMTNWTWKSWWEAIVKQGRSNFGMESLSDNEFRIENMFIGVAASIGLFQRRINGSFFDLFLLTAALTLWSKANCFSKSLKQSDPVTSSWPAVLKEYKSLRTLSDMINSTFGNMITCFLINGILDYALSLDELISETKWTDWNNLLGVTFYVCYTAAFLYISADVCQQMSALKVWLSVEENQVDIPPNQFHSLLNELDTNRVAIKGSGVFSLTYSLVANMVGITVTYFIICVQA